MRWILPFLFVAPIFLCTVNAILNRWSRIHPHRTPFTAGRYTIVVFIPAFVALQLLPGTSSGSEVFAGLVFLTLYLGCLIFLNWFIFVLTDVSMHIQLMTQIHKRGSATVAELQKSYNKDVILENRIPRLLELGQLHLRNGKLVLAGRSGLFFGAFVTAFLRRILGIPVRPELADHG
jgi:hypothetical protein